MKKWLLVLLILYASFAGFSQDFSNKGKDFWVAYTGHIDGTASRMALYITADQDATVTVEVNGVSTAPVLALANKVTTIQLTTSTTPSNTLAYNSQTEGVGIKKGIHIISDRAVAVYAHILNAARSGSTLVIPTTVLGREYYAASYQTLSAGSGKYSEFAVLATEDSTTVEIIPTRSDIGSKRVANVSYQVKLNKGDVYQYQSFNDLSGSYIKSVASATAPCKPIAVFSGSSWTAMGCSNASSGDNLYQQMFPFTSWGKVYYTAPFKNKSYDIFRIFVQDPSEQVFVNGVALALSSILSNRFYEISTSGNNKPQVINSSKPICVLQYITAQNCDNVPSDPEMIILNSIEQTLSDITVMSARKDLTPPNTQIDNHYLNIIFKTSTLSSLKIDNAAPLSTPVAIGTTGYSYLQEDVTTSTNSNPYHRIISDSGFVCIAYGFGAVESYGYNAGTNVKDLYQYVTLQNQNASVNFPATCKGTPLNLSITLPYLPLSLMWDFANNTGISPNANITNSAPIPDSIFVKDGRTLNVFKLPGQYTFTAKGTFPIKVTVNNPTADGCSGLQEINYDVIVYDSPKANFTITNSGCVTDDIKFFDATNGNGRATVKWNWDFGDNTLANVKDPVKKYSSAATGSYPVKLTSINDIGCLADTTILVAISTVPQVAFGISDTICAGKTIVFSDSSSNVVGNIVKWYWDYGDGVKDTVLSKANRSHSYSPWGSKTASLKVETNTGCKTAVNSKNIIIHPIPVAGFILPGGICLPADSARFTNASSLADGNESTLRYWWTFGDAPSGINNESSIKNPAHYYNSTGPFSIHLTTTSAAGCVHDSTQVISNVYLPASANFTVNAENCLKDTSFFTSTSNGNGNAIANWNWDFGDGSPKVAIQHPTYLYATSGTKNIKHWIVTDKGCKSDTIAKSIVVNPLPTGNFNVSLPSCETKNISFTDASLANAGSLAGWKWDFGDLSSGTSNLSILQTSSHSFSVAGNYLVSFIVSTDKGCVSPVKTKSVVINPQPMPGFIVPEVCLSDTYAEFRDTSSIASGSIVNWLWNFGDPVSGALNISTLQNPQHSYKAVGPYTVSLIVTSIDGCSSKISQAFFVNASNPTADFTVGNAATLCANDSVSITNISSVFPGSVTKVEIYWDNLGAPTVFQLDDLPAIGKIYKHLYPNFQSPLTKNFIIRLRAYSGGICVKDKLQTITINAAPKVKFTSMPNTCLDALPFQITQASEIGGVPGSFKFSGPGISNTGIFSPAIAGAGTHTILYTYTSSAGGCVDTITQRITVLAAPIADFTFDLPACETNNILFNSTATSSVGTLTTFAWDFGDGSSAVIKNTPVSFAHIFAAAGDYSVALKVTTSNGCVSSVKQLLVAVRPQPKPNFSVPASACLPVAAVPFSNLTTIADGTENALTYAWSFDDPISGVNNSSVAKSPTHVYTSTGSYNVNLKVTSGNGCFDDTTIVLNSIHTQPAASFSSDLPSVCLGNGVTFSDMVSGLDGVATAWNWDVGDGQQDRTSNPVHLYKTASTFDVSLSITNNFGCNSDTITKLYTVYPNPTVDVGPDRVVLEGGSLVLPSTVSGKELQYLWTPALYLNSATNPTPTVMNPLTDIGYTLTITAKGGCTATDSLFIKILSAVKVPNLFSPNGDGINDRWLIKYLDSYPDCNLQVFTRNGQLVYETRQYSDATAWDGTLKGKPLPFDTYYYILQPGSGRKPITGYVTIVK